MTATLSQFLPIIAGFVLLFAGRRFVWLAAALSAFLFTYNLIQSILGPGLVGLIIAVVIGAIFAGLALAFVRFIAFAIGALAGAAGMPILLGLFHITWSWWIMALIGAVLGILVISIALNIGLILMTAWIGANTLAGSAAPLLGAGAGASGLIFVILLVAGIIVQLMQLRGRG